jgi:hypothetical protein
MGNKDHAGIAYQRLRINSVERGYAIIDAN